MKNKLSNQKLNFLLLVLFNIFAAILTQIFFSSNPFGINCDLDCGETLLAINAAEQFREVGFEYLGTENYGTVDNPILYTHNINIGSILFTIFEYLKISLQIKFILVWIIYIFSVIILSLSVNRMFKSPIYGFTTSLIFHGMYWHLSIWSTSALRTWHFLAFSLSLYFLTHFNKKNSSYLLLFITGVSALFAGYDYFIFISSYTIVGFFLLNKKDMEGIKNHLFKIVVILTVSFTAVLLVRSLTMSKLLGWQFIMYDFYQTIKIKIPFLGQTSELNLEEIDKVYQSNNVLRAPAEPSSNFLDDMQTFFRFLEFVMLPRSTSILLLFIVFMLIISSIGYNFNQFKNSPVLAKIRVLFISGVIATSILFIALSPFSLHVYMKHKFPMIYLYIFLTVSLILSRLVQLTFQNNSSNKVLKIPYIFAWNSIILMLIGLQVNNQNNSPRWDLSWLNELKNNSEENILIVNYPISGAIEPHPLILIAYGVDKRGDRITFLQGKLTMAMLSNYDLTFYHNPNPLFDVDNYPPRCIFKDIIFGAIIPNETPNPNSKVGSCNRADVEQIKRNYYIDDILKMIQRSTQAKSFDIKVFKERLEVIRY